MLDVSDATVRNWIRAGLLNRIETASRLALSKSEVGVLQNAIESGSVPRLAARANKTQSSSRRLHTELLGDTASREWVVLAKKMATEGVHDRDVLAHFAVHLASLTASTNAADLVLGEQAESNDFILAIREEIQRWSTELSQSPAAFFRAHNEITFPCTASSDVLGLVYQHQKSAGTKSKDGSFFTPTEVVRLLVRDTVVQDDMVLDPCCGSGAFLIEACKYFIEQGVRNPLEKIVGTDIDEVSVRICSLNLLLCCYGAAEVCSPNILRLDATDIHALDECLSVSAPDGITYA